MHTGPVYKELGYNEQVSSSCIFSLGGSQTNLYTKPKHIRKKLISSFAFARIKEPSDCFPFEKKISRHESHWCPPNSHVNDTCPTGIFQSYFILTHFFNKFHFLKHFCNLVLSFLQQSDHLKIKIANDTVIHHHLFSSIRWKFNRVFHRRPEFACIHFG